jgi:hypothetical protein
MCRTPVSNRPILSHIFICRVRKRKLNPDAPAFVPIKKSSNSKVFVASAIVMKTTMKKEVDDCTNSGSGVIGNKFYDMWTSQFGGQFLLAKLHHIKDNDDEEEENDSGGSSSSGSLQFFCI